MNQVREGSKGNRDNNEWVTSEAKGLDAPGPSEKQGRTKFRVNPGRQESRAVCPKFPTLHLLTKDLNPEGPYPTPVFK